MSINRRAVMQLIASGASLGKTQHMSPLDLLTGCYNACASEDVRSKRWTSTLRSCSVQDMGSSSLVPVGGESFDTVTSPLGVCELKDHSPSAQRGWEFS